MVRLLVRVDTEHIVNDFMPHAIQAVAEKLLTPDEAVTLVVEEIVAAVRSGKVIVLDD